MKVKNLSIFLAESSQDFTKVVGGKHNDIELNLSSSINLCIQFCQLMLNENKLPLTTSELLFCCDILNGGAQMTEFKTPDTVNIGSAFESMFFSLSDAAINNYGGEVEKWEIDVKSFVGKFKSLQEPHLAFTLAMATRQFWSETKLPNFKGVQEVDGYKEWALQWVENPNRK